MLSVSLVGDQAVIAKLTGMPEKLHKALVKKCWSLALKLQAYIRANKLSGQVLNHQSGKLWRSIQSGVDDNPGSVYGKVFSSGDVKYAGIHEFGGTTKPHIIRAVNAKALAFKDYFGDTAFYKQVMHPGSKMPERSYMRAGLADMKDQIVEGLSEAVREGIS